MTRAFIVKVDVQNMITLQETADDIFEDLTNQGYMVVSVAPWRSHGEPAPLVPTPTQQTVL